MLDFGYYNMDCMQGMKEFPDGYFDLAIVDPPYGDGGGAGADRRDSDSGSTDTEGRLPRQTLHRPRREVSLTKMGGGTERTDTSRTDSEKANVHRTGGTWAAKFGKKS